MSIESNTQESKTVPEVISFFADTFGNEPFFFEDFLELDQEKKSRLAKFLDKEIILENKMQIQTKMDYIKRNNEGKLRKCSFSLNGSIFTAYSVNPNFSPAEEAPNLKKIALERFKPKKMENAHLISPTELEYYNTLVAKVNRRENPEDEFSMSFFPM